MLILSRTYWNRILSCFCPFRWNYGQSRSALAQLGVAFSRSSLGLIGTFYVLTYA